MSKNDGPTLDEQFAERLNDWSPPDFDPSLDFLIYGQTGAGKTTLVKTLKSDCRRNDGHCLHLTNDKGDDSILSAVHDADHWLVQQEIETMNDLRAAAFYLKKRQHPFQWVTLDDATRMASIMNDELKNEFVDDTWGRYGALNSRFRRLLRAFRDLDTNTLLLAREGTKEGSDVATAAFPGKALGTGNDTSSVLHEFSFGFRMVREPRDNQVDRFYLQTKATDGAEAKKRDEFHVLDEQEEPDISAIRKKWVDAQRDNLDK